MTQTTKLEVFAVMDENGHFRVYTLHSQQDEIIDFMLSDGYFSSLIVDANILTPEDLRDMKYTEFIAFLKEHILHRGTAELTHISYTPRPEDPF